MLSFSRSINLIHWILLTPGGHMAKMCQNKVPNTQLRGSFEYLLERSSFQVVNFSCEFSNCLLLCCLKMLRQCKRQMVEDIFFILGHPYLLQDLFCSLVEDVEVSHTERQRLHFQKIVFKNIYLNHIFSEIITIIIQIY